MTHRLFAAGPIAILGIGLMLAPADAFARGGRGGVAGGGGGMAAGRAGPVPGGFRAPVMRPVLPAARPAPLMSPALRARGPLSFPAAKGATARHVHGLHKGLHRRPAVWGWPLAMWGYGYGGYYGPDAYPYTYVQDPSFPPAAAYPPIDTFEPPAAPRRIVVVRRATGCSSEKVKVDSEGGGERTITIVRC